MIAIPTKGRHLIIQQTLKTLAEIDPDLIYIFVVENEYDLYRNAVDKKYRIIIGENGLVNQRKFIENYFPAGSHIVFLDDDIKSVDLVGYPDLNTFFSAAFAECIANDCFIWSVYPVWNKYFREKRPRVNTCLTYMIGAFYGVINRPNDPDLQIKICTNDNKEDVERSLLYFKKDGIVLRYNQIGINTTYFGSVGGIGTLKDRMYDNNINTHLLLEKYDCGKLKIRKSGLCEFVFKPIKAYKKDTEIQILDQIHPEEFSLLYEMLESISLPMTNANNTRRGFAFHRSTGFGIIRQRHTNNLEISYYSKKYPEIHAEMERIGNKFCPFKYTSIHTNKNVVCPPHRDGANKGKSMLLSFGEYTGCNIVVEGTKLNADCQPIIFNGADLEHWNTDDLVGTKYSLVFYNAGVDEKKII